ncbi:hypothetical protein RJ639_046760, partial [Escallonia herrerae]
ATPSMACAAESSSAPPDNDKPVIVRVKRRASQSSLEAFWLEINERPLKRPLLGFESLSLSDSSAKVEEALKVKKVFVQHVETVSSSEPGSTVAVESDAKRKDQRRTFRTEIKEDKLLEKAKGQQEICLEVYSMLCNLPFFFHGHQLLSKNARFEQIWRHRKGKKEAMHDEAIHDICRLYDVVRVDADETSTNVQEKEDLEDDMMMPTSKDDYVYDLYAVKNGISMAEEDASNLFPLVQVDDDDGFYAGPDASEYESDDSNAENNPLNDYPDEESSDDAEVESRTSDDKSEEDECSTASGKSSEVESLGHHDFSDGGDPLFEDDIYGDDDYDVYGCDEDDDGDDEDWR